MTLSPFEVERQEFGRTPFGYRRREVDDFLDTVRTTLVSLWQERADMREQLERLQERVERFTAMEDQLKNTLILAQDSAEKATEQARRESELVLREAGQQAREIVHAAHAERQRLETALRDLSSAEQDTRQRVRAMATAILAHLDDTESGTDDNAVVFQAQIAEDTEASPRSADLPQVAAGDDGRPFNRQARELVDAEEMTPVFDGDDSQLSPVERAAAEHPDAVYHGPLA